MRVVFDVNVLIRGILRSPVVARLLGHAAEGRFIVLTSDLLLQEFADCALKPRLAERVDWGLYNKTLSFLIMAGKTIQIQPPFPSCRDPKDGYLLAVVQEGSADYLVTLDNDLLCLSPFGACEILTPEVFEVRLDEGDEDL